MDRRRFLMAAGAGVTAALAGCSGDGQGDDGTPTTGGTSTDTPAGTATNGTATGTGEGTTAANQPYTVSIEPMGEVTFEEVPQTWVANNGSWADMGIALGLEPPAGVYLPGRYHTQYYDAIPGVSVDKSNVQKIWGSGGVGKEQFHAFNADVHVMDPNFLMNRASWTQSDVDDIAEIAPFFANSVFSRGYPWHEDYRYYTLFEAFEKLAEVFQRTERYEAFEDVHADFKSNLAPAVPARSERPEVAVVWGSGDAPEQFYPYVVDQGTSFKHVRALKLKDALATSDVKNFHSSRGAIDFETLLEVDPEVLLLRGQEAKTAEEFRNTVVSYMKDHDVASELTAVKNGDVYRGGGLYQGPITYQVLTERLARQLYGVEEELFDKQRVADVVAGEF